MAHAQPIAVESRSEPLHISDGPRTESTSAKTSVACVKMPCSMVFRPGTGRPARGSAPAVPDRRPSSVAAGCRRRRRRRTAASGRGNHG